MVYIDTQWAETGSVPQPLACIEVSSVDARLACLDATQQWPHSALKTRIENRGDISMKVGLEGTVLYV